MMLLSVEPSITAGGAFRPTWSRGNLQVWVTCRRRCSLVPGEPVWGIRAYGTAALSAYPGLHFVKLPGRPAVILVRAGGGVHGGDAGGAVRGSGRAQGHGCGVRADHDRQECR